MASVPLGRPALKRLPRLFPCSAGGFLWPGLGLGVLGGNFLAGGLLLRGRARSLGRGFLRSRRP
jgi:hypothetical protein